MAAGDHQTLRPGQVADPDGVGDADCDRLIACAPAWGGMLRAIKRRNARIREMSRAHRLPDEAAWVEALIESGVPPREAEDLLWLTVSIVRGLAIRRLLADDPPRFARVLALWRRMAVEHVERLTRSPGTG
jgi:hypothetical protein